MSSRALLILAAGFLIANVMLAGGCQGAESTKPTGGPADLRTTKELLAKVDRIVIRYGKVGDGNRNATTVVTDKRKVVEFVEACIASGRPMEANPAFFLEPSHEAELRDSKTNELIVTVQVSIYDTAFDVGPDLVRLMDMHKPRGASIWEWGTEEDAAAARKARPIPIRMKAARRISIAYSSVDNPPYVRAEGHIDEPRELDTFLAALKATGRRFVPFADPPSAPCHAIRIHSKDDDSLIAIWVPRDAKASEWGSKVLWLIEKHKPQGLQIWEASK